MRHRNTGAPPGLAGKNAMRTALGHKVEGEFDRLAIVALSLLFQPATREAGKGMIAEMYRGHYKHDDPRISQAPGQSYTPVPSIQEVIASMAVTKFSAQNATALWNAIPGPCLLDTLGAVLMYALLDEDGGWIRAAKDKVEDLRLRDKRHATNGRVAVLCGEVAHGLKLFWNSTPLPEARISTSSWQRCLSWMVERMVIGMFDEQGLPHDRRGATHPDPVLMGQAEWLAQSLTRQDFGWSLEIGQALGRIHVPSYPTLAAAGANIRRQHLDNSVVPARERDVVPVQEEEVERRL